MKQRGVIIAIILGSLVLLMTLLFFLFRPSGTTPDTGEQYDANSGETVSNPPDKAPETVGNDSTVKEPLYLGFSQLTDRGFTQFQLAATKQAFINFAEKQAFSQVSITKDSASHLFADPNDPNSYPGLSFKVVIDSSKTYYVTARCVNSSIVDVTLFNDADLKDVAFAAGQIDGIQTGE